MKACNIHYLQCPCQLVCIMAIGQYLFLESYFLDVNITTLVLHHNITHARHVNIFSEQQCVSILLHLHVHSRVDRFNDYNNQFISQNTCTMVKRPKIATYSSSPRKHKTSDTSSYKTICRQSVVSIIYDALCVSWMLPQSKQLQHLKSCLDLIP